MLRNLLTIVALIAVAILCVSVSLELGRGGNVRPDGAKDGDVLVMNRLIVDSEKDAVKWDGEPAWKGNRQPEPPLEFRLGKPMPVIVELINSRSGRIWIDGH